MNNGSRTFGSRGRGPAFIRFTRANYLIYLKVGTALYIHLRTPGHCRRSCLRAQIDGFQFSASKTYDG
jgi:hypothetical protein